MRFFLFLTLSKFIFGSFVILAQDEAKIENLHAKSESGKVIVYFDLISQSSADSFFVDLIIKSKDGNQYHIQHILGDYGTINSGINKKMEWYVKEDGYVIDDLFDVQLISTPIVKLKKYSHLLKSALIPGLGDYKVRNGKFHVLYSLLTYGATATALILNRRAHFFYDEYQRSFELEKSKELYSKSLINKQLSIVSAMLATLSWSMDLVLLNVRLNKLEKDISKSNYFQSQKKKKIEVIIPSVYLNTKSNADRAIEMGDDYFAKKRYEEALEQYQIAKTDSLGVQDSVDFKINSVLQQITSIKDLKEKYEILIKNGDQLLTENNFLGAKNEYEKALSLNSDWDLAQEKIEEVENQMLKKINQDFDTLIKNGQRFFAEQNYEEAKNEYNKALLLKSEETFPKVKIAEIESIINSKNIQSAKLKNAEDFFVKREYQNAKSLFEEVFLLNTDSKISKRIAQCDSLIIVEQNNKIDKQVEGILNIAQKFYEAKQFKLAIDKLEEAIQIKPESTRVKELKIKYKMEFQKYLEEENDFKYNMLIKKGISSLEKNEFVKAEAYFQEALLIKPYEIYPLGQLEKIEKMIENK